MCELTKVQARVRFFTEKEGGRRHPIYSRYKPYLYFLDGVEVMCMLTFTHKDFISLGDTDIVEIDLLLGDKIIGSKCFVMQEGKRIIGVGEIIKI